jgi:hypothetical protein
MHELNDSNFVRTDLYAHNDLYTYNATVTKREISRNKFDSQRVSTCQKLLRKFVSFVT